MMQSKMHHQDFLVTEKLMQNLVAENLAERMGLVYDDLPTKQKIKFI